MIIAGLAVSFSLVKMYDGGIFEVLWEYPLLPDEVEKLMEFLSQNPAALFIDLSWDRV